MTKDLLKALSTGRKFTLHCECIIGGVGLNKGESYTRNCIVHREARRVRRIWEDPMNYKVATIAIESGGYFEIKSTDLDKSEIKKTENGFIVTGKKDKFFNHPVLVETYTFL